MTISPTQNDPYSKVLQGISKGTAIMLLQTPLVTSFNRISVVSCYKNIPAIAAIRQIYWGAVDGAKYASINHFFRGISGHLVKETARVSFKASGIVLKPSLDHHFHSDPSGKINLQKGNCPSK